MARVLVGRLLALTLVLGTAAANAAPFTLADVQANANLNGDRVVRLQTSNSNAANASQNVHRVGQGGEFLVEIDTNGSADNSGPNGGWKSVDVFTSNGQPASNWVYKTFCVEGPGVQLETFNPGTAYYATIDNKAYHAGSPGVGVALHSDVKLAYGLYSEGLLGGIGGFLYNSPTWAGVLQNMIWDLQNGVTLNHVGPASAQESLWRAIDTWSIANAANIQKDTQWQGFVQVLNLWNSKPDTAEPYIGELGVQSQLINLNPQNIDGPVPEPFSLAIWGSFAVVGFMAYRRKRR